MYRQKPKNFNPFLVAFLVISNSIILSAEEYWEKMSPFEYTSRLTTEMIMAYSGIKFDECCNRLMEDPKDFIIYYQENMKYITEVSNEAFEQTYEELQRLNGSQEANKDKIENFVHWLYKATKHLVSQKNYLGAYNIATALSLDRGYLLKTNTVEKKTKGIKREKIERLFKRHVNPVSAQVFENNKLLHNEFFLPNIMNIPTELERIANGYYAESEWKEITTVVCNKISRENFLKFKNSFLSKNNKSL